MNKLKIIIGSIRDNRNGELVKNWLVPLVKNNPNFETKVLDLKEWDLPKFHSAKPPMMGGYEEPMTQKWAKVIEEGDAYIIVTPEYNHGYPASIKDALDHIYKEWNRKPVAFVGYGGIAGGARAVEQLRQVAVELQMAPTRTAIHIPMVWEAFDEKGMPKHNMDGQVDGLVADLYWWSEALRKSRG